MFDFGIKSNLHTKTQKLPALADLQALQNGTFLHWALVVLLLSVLCNCLGLGGGRMQHKRIPPLPMERSREDGTKKGHAHWKRELGNNLLFSTCPHWA